MLSPGSGDLVEPVFLVIGEGFGVFNSDGDALIAEDEHDEVTEFMDKAAYFLTTEPDNGRIVAVGSIACVEVDTVAAR